MDSNRKGAAVSFAVTLLVIGIPLWWKTTEVYRASLPYNEIEEIDPSEVDIGMKLYVSGLTPSSSLRAISDLKSKLVKMHILNVELVSFDIADAEYNKLELTSNKWLPGDLGDLCVVEVPQLDETEILVTNRRLIYFTREADFQILLSFLIDHLFEDSKLQTKVTTIVNPQAPRTNDDLVSKSLRASLNYDVIISVVNSDPERLNVDWDVSTQVNRYFNPLLNQINDISFHAVKSQWLYLLDLGEKPKMDSTGMNVITHSQLPHIITPLEKKLGSGISVNPCVHFVLYIASCMQKPLTFASESGHYIDSLISPLWGGIQVVNPSTKHCENSTVFAPNSEKVFGSFASQFHSLLGLRDHGEYEDRILFIKRRGPLLRDWELDSLYRTRIVEQITSASLTLQSLSKLLGEIGNIVINEDVAGSINLAVEQIDQAKTLLKTGQLVEALRHSKVAFSASERAFSDPSLLALLYFPDDQKYAVYIPLFLPIMIPVLMSLKKIYSWSTCKIN